MSDEKKRGKPSIATRRGDAGDTRLGDGTAISKMDLRVDAYGAIDELNAFIGAARAQCDDVEIRTAIRTIQRELFAVGAAVSTTTHAADASPTIDPDYVGRLDALVERFEAEPGIVADWTVPGESAAAAAFDVARTVCRRTERINVRYANETGDVQPMVLAYLNRLSDVLWLCARVVEARTGIDARLRDDAHPGAPWSRAWGAVPPRFENVRTVTQNAESKPINDGTTPAPPCTLVIFGAGGDLTKRLLTPALYNLAGSGLLSDGLRIVGLDHNDRTTDDWKNDLAATMQSFTKDKTAEFHADRIDAKQWAFVADRLTYLVADFEDPASYANLKTTLEKLGTANDNANAMFYLAVADRFFGTIVDRLGEAGLLEEKDGAFRRIVIEKPFGSDLPSAKALNERITKIASESQIYRIDHFLGKEPVQSIMAMRFGNGLFEPMWRREHVDHVQITAAETIGVEERGGFYEATGALRDMVPNHLFQLLTMITMETPNSFEPENVRSEKAKLVEAIRPVDPHNVVRGQYGAGAIDGHPVIAYRDEHNVAKDSTTETYAALRIDVENWRWSGVPFYLRTGKRLGTRLTSIAIHFKPAPYRIFRDTPVEKMTPNVLTLMISPKQGMSTDFSAKVPGPAMRLGRVSTEFSYDDFFDEPPNVGYETLIYDCMIGDATLFQRADQIDSSWAAVQPTRDAWNSGGGDPLEIYPAGSAGPSAADALLARDGRSWLPLTIDADRRRQAVAH